MNEQPGKGTAVDPILVKTAEDLYNVRKDLQGYYKQICDIDISNFGRDTGKGWNPIGDDKAPFSGQYDGSGFMIVGLYYESNLDDYISAIGLFGSIQNATLINICLEKASISAFDSGILVGGTATDSNIINCHVRKSFTGNRGNSGLVNDIVGGRIELCSSDTVARVYTCGYSGIFSTATGTLITRCWAKVDVHFASTDPQFIWQSDTFCGFGQIASACTIIDCYAIGRTVGRLWQCGFLQGFDCDYGQYAGIQSIITNCYSAVQLKSISKELPPPYYSVDPMKGGFAYEVAKDSCQETSCYFDKDLAGTEHSEVAKGLGTEQMKKKTAYKGWDFIHTWEIKDKCYPTLRGNKEN